GEKVLPLTDDGRAMLKAAAGAGMAVSGRLGEAGELLADRADNMLSGERLASALPVVLNAHREAHGIEGKDAQEAFIKKALNPDKGRAREQASAGGFVDRLNAERTYAQPPS